MKYVKNTLVHFQHGKIKTNENRIIIYAFMRSSLLAFPFKHPINSSYFSMSVANIKETNFFEQFNPNMLTNKKHSFYQNKRFWYFSDFQLIVKGGGVGNYIKCLNALWHSREHVKLFVGKQGSMFSNTLVISKIYKRMGSEYDEEEHTKKKGAKSSTIVATILKKGIKIIKPFDTLEWGSCLLKTAIRCSNKYGSRTINICSHGVAALKFVQLKYLNEKIIDPTPQNSKYVKNVFDISAFSYKMSQKDVGDMLHYIHQQITQFRKNAGWDDVNTKDIDRLIELYLEKKQETQTEQQLFQDEMEMFTDTESDEESTQETTDRESSGEIERQDDEKKIEIERNWK